MTSPEPAPTVKPEGIVGDTPSTAVSPQNFIAHVSFKNLGHPTEGTSTVALCTEFSPDDVTGLTHVYVKGVRGLYTESANSDGPSSPAASCIQRAWSAFDEKSGIVKSKSKQTVQEALDNSILGHNPSHDLKRHFEDVLMSFVRVNLDKSVANVKASMKDLKDVEASELYTIAMFPSDSKIFEDLGSYRCVDYTAQEYHGRPEKVRMTQEVRKTDWSGALQALQESKYSLREIASPIFRYGPRTAPGRPTFLAVTLTMETDTINRDVMAKLEHCIGHSTEWVSEGGQEQTLTKLSTVIADKWEGMLNDGRGKSSAEACVRKATLGDERSRKQEQVPKLTQSEVIQSLLQTLSDAIKQRVSNKRLARDFRVVYYPKQTFDSLASSRSNLECAYTDPLFQGIGENRPN